MSTTEDEEAEARFEAWNERTQGGTLQDAIDVIESFAPCPLCGSQPMTAMCNNGGCDD